MEEIGGMLKDINATGVFDGEGDSSDTEEWVKVGVPGAELWNDDNNYFDYHHTHGQH